MPLLRINSIVHLSEEPNITENESYLQITIFLKNLRWVDLWSFSYAFLIAIACLLCYNLKTETKFKTYQIAKEQYTVPGNMRIS